MAEFKLNDIDLILADAGGISIESDDCLSWSKDISKADLFNHILSHKYKENLGTCDNLMFKHRAFATFYSISITQNPFNKHTSFVCATMSI